MFIVSRAGSATLVALLAGCAQGRATLPARDRPLTIRVGAPVGTPIVTTGTRLAVGSAFTCAIDRASGAGSPSLADRTSVWCWGFNEDGELGRSPGEAQATPARVPGLATAVEVAAGTSHACARLEDGSVWCWGGNDHGELGSGNTRKSWVPVRALTAAPAVSLVAGGQRTCAVLGDGRAQCWGSNRRGGVGDGTQESRATPTFVRDLVGVASISMGDLHSCAMTTAGRALCWGSGLHAAVLGATRDVLAPSPVPLDALAVSAGGNQTCAIVADGAVQCWGYNISLELGTRTSSAVSEVPVSVPGLRGARALALGIARSCAFMSDASVVCWGRAGGAMTGVPAPPSPLPLDEIAELGLGAFHTCARVRGGAIRCWGSNRRGQLGRWEPQESLEPLEVELGR